MKKIFLIPLFLGVLLTSCNSKVDNPYVGYDKTETGLYYKFYNKNNATTKLKRHF